MLIHTKNENARRFIAILTLLCCLFWSTIGLSTHSDEDSEFFGGQYSAASSSPVESVTAPARFHSSSKNDICPACKFRDACVSGAVAVSVLPELPQAAIRMQQAPVHLFSIEPAPPSSRGPPCA